MDAFNLVRAHMHPGSQRMNYYMTVLTCDSNGVPCKQQYPAYYTTGFGVFLLSFLLFSQATHTPNFHWNIVLVTVSVHFSLKKLK